MADKLLTKKTIDERLSNDLKSQIISIGIVLAVVIYYVANREWQTTNPLGFVFIIVLIMSMEIALQVPATKKMPIFNSGGPVPLTVYNISLFVVMAFYIPLYSPFVIALATVVFFTVYYSSLYSFMLAAANIIGLVIINTIMHGYPNVPHGYLYPYLMVLLGISYIGIVQRAGIMNRNVRNELSDAGERISQEREQLGSLINSIKDSVISTDENGNILFYNTTFLRRFNLPTIDSRVPFSKIVKLYDNRSNPVDFFSLYDKSLDKQDISDIHFIDSNQQKVYLSIEISKINSQTDSHDGLIILMRDITKEKSLDDERNEFISVTSHELRTPIAVTEANISLILNNQQIPLADDFKRMLIKAHNEVLNLADIVNQLTELSEIDRKDLVVDFTDVEPLEMINAIKEQYSESVKFNAIDINLEHADNLPLIKTSKIYLKLILENFMTNSIKYTQSGSITISAKLSNIDPSRIIFSVKDTGDGIGTTDKEKIFTKYFRSEDYKNKHTRGTGLGLYLTLKVAKLINGKIWFDSELGKGSTFYLELPTNRL
ncbi:MAG: PAS domain-containing sensor histidine kinase [Candidatus Saccharibacteria bacterium]